MLKVAVVGSLLLLLASLSPAFAYEFPGKGDRQSWLQACDLSNQAGQLFQMGNFADAFKGFETSIQLYAFDAVLFYNAGVAHQTFAYLPANAATKNAELQTAEKYFLEALKLKSDEVQILAHLANVQTVRAGVRPEPCPDREDHAPPETHPWHRHPHQKNHRPL